MNNPRLMTTPELNQSLVTSAATSSFSAAPQRLASWDDRVLHWLIPQHLVTLPAVWRYTLALAIIALATILRRALLPWMGDNTPYNLALLAVIASTSLMGIGPGLFTVFVGDIAVEVFVMGPLTRMLEGPVLVRFGSALVIGILVVLIFYFMRAVAIRSHQSEARLAALAAATFEGVVESDAGRLIDCNEQFARMTGRTVPELIGAAIADLIAPEDRSRVMANIDHNRESMVEHAILRPDGTRILVEAHGRPSVAGGPVRYTVVREITGRKQIERQLFETHQRLAALMNALPVGVSFSDDATCQHITGNPAVLAQFEVRSEDNLSASAPAADAPGRQVRFFLEGRSIPDTELPLQRAVKENRVIPPMELEVHLPSGRCWFAAASGAPIHDQNGQVIGGVAVTEDITQRKQAEQALRQVNADLERRIAERTAELVKAGEKVQAERQRFLDMLDTLPVVIDIIRADHCIEWANRAYRDALGDNTGRFCYESQFGREQPCEECQAFTPFQTGQPHHWEWTLPNGRTFDIYNFPFTAADGSPAILEMDIDITEQRHAEAALKNLNETLERRVAERTKELRESQERFQIAKEAAALGIHDYDVALGTIQWDAKTRELWGVGLEEPITFDTFLSGLHPDDRAATQAAVDRALDPRGDGRYYAEYRVRNRRDGSERHIAATGKVTFAGGKPVRLVGTVQDITVRKAAEAALAESEQRYRRIVETAEEGIATHEPDGTITYVNQRMADMLGYSREEIITRSSLDFVDDDEKEAVIRAREHLKERGNFSTERKLRRKDGSILWTLSNITPRRNSDGNFLGYLAMHTDITERKQADAALRESEVRYRSLFENMRNGLAYCRMIFEDGQPRDFVYLAVNSMFETLTGLREVVGKKISELIPGLRESDPKLFEIYSRVASSGVSEQFEIYVESLKMWFSVSVYSPTKEYFVAIFDVITARKQAEEQIQRQMEELRVANDDLRRFNRLAVGRELRVIELKAEINALCRETGQPLRYPATLSNRSEPANNQL